MSPSIDRVLPYLSLIPVAMAVTDRAKEKKPGYNVFDKVKWNNTGEELALNAGLTRTIVLGTKAQLANYAPFVRFMLENNSDEVIAMYVDGQADGTTGVAGGYKDVMYLQPKTAKEIVPYDNGEPDIVFTSITLKNTSATNTANSEVSWRVANY